MAKRKYELVTQKFTGPRFEDHGLDIDVLPELIAYKKLLIETAKEIWWRKHPDRERIQRNFEASLRLKFYRLAEGSVAVPLEREIEVEEGLLNFEPVPDELDEAARVLEEAIDAASADAPLPSDFPKNVIPLFEQLGKTLEADDSMEFEPPPGARTRKKVVYTQQTRTRMVERATGEYTDVVSVSGEIRAADLDGGSFNLRREDGSRLSGKFSPEHEAQITEALKEHQSCSLEVEGTATFFPDGKIKRIEKVDKLQIISKERTDFDASAKPIWEVAQEIGKSVPQEEWEKVPKDGSINVDHYLYGNRKIS
jgi:hypothetical protein